MSNFKSGSGDLDFGGGDEGDETDDSSNDAARTAPEKESEQEDSTQAEQSESDPMESASSDVGQATEQTASTGTRPGSDSGEEYPYFVRRSNVGDERDTRLEIHVRDKVAEQEGEFRNELAERLGANEISKTDAREFALLAAYQHPEQVAELLRDEGFGTLG